MPQTVALPHIATKGMTGVLNRYIGFSASGGIFSVTLGAVWPKQSVRGEGVVDA